MSPTPRPAADRGRVVVVLTGWAVAMLLLAVVAVVAAVAPEEVPDAADLGWLAVVGGIVAITVQAVVLLRAWASPRPALVAVAAVVPLGAAAGLGAATGVTAVVVLIAAYRAVVGEPWPRPAPALAVAAALVGIGDLVRAVQTDDWSLGGLTVGSVGAAVLQGAGTVALAAVVGAMVASRRETARARVGRDVAVAGQQVALTQAAVARERVAMARELHDIAAHHLSGIAVMTAALDRQIDTDPAGAKIAVRQVRQQSTAMLKDLRSLVALLRDDDPARAGLEIAPETLHGIPVLVDTARRAGRDVELSVLGTSADEISSLGIGPLAQLAAYRTVQESLANAARHAPGAPCEVVIDVRDPSQVVLVVRNSAPPAAATRPPAAAPGGGFGIVGMRERADLTDARLSAGPTPDGGWVVQLTIPTETMEDPR
jgi:signal transduction histidine kinase